MIRLHWPFALLAAIGLVLVFTNLGSGYLWADGAGARGEITFTYQ